MATKLGSHIQEDCPGRGAELAFIEEPGVNKVTARCVLCGLRMPLLRMPEQELITDWLASLLHSIGAAKRKIDADSK